MGEAVENQAGFHGAAVTARAELRRPKVIRFDTTGVWFTAAREEPRVGGRMAIAATVPWGDRELVAACVHLESHGDPAGRAGQMESLLAELDVYAESRPVVLGGDFNSFSAAAIETYRSAFREAMLREDPDRFVDPARYEPLFAAAEARGYDWRAANAPGPSQRTKPSGYPKPPLMRIDWLFVRGVAAGDPATVPAVARDGEAISDHDLIAVTLI